MSECLTPSQLRNSLEASAMQVVQKDLMDMLVKELKEELEARDQRAISAQDRQQGMAAPWRLHARSCARASCTRAIYDIENMETFTVL